MNRIILLSLALAIAFLASCANTKAPLATISKTDPEYQNPYETGTYDHFKAEKSYPKTHNTWTNTQLLAQTNVTNSWLRIDRFIQRGFLMNDNEVVIDYPISSGKRSHPTPDGTYKILEKIVDKSSNKYGRMYDIGGVLINGDANAFVEEVPEGGKFVGAPMKYWMRLTWDGIGHHIGPIPRGRYPASHACIRGPRKTMPVVYSKLAVGSKVVVD